jgi:hypothetical protein
MKQVLDERITPWNGTLYTRKALLEELQARGASAAFIEYWVFHPEALSDQYIEALYEQGKLINRVPNVFPAWYTDTLKAEEQRKEAEMANLQTFRDEDGMLIAFSRPDGYPCYYLDVVENVLCPACANKPSMPGSEIIAGALHWEGPPLICDNCGAAIESASGDPDEESEAST